MEFCPVCGASLIPEKNKLKCRCGYERLLFRDDVKEQYKFKGEKNRQRKVIVTNNDSYNLSNSKWKSFKIYYEFLE